MGFWSNFWGFVKKKIDEYDEEKKVQVKIQPWEDVREYNPLADDLEAKRYERGNSRQIGKNIRSPGNQHRPSIRADFGRAII